MESSTLHDQGADVRLECRLNGGLEVSKIGQSRENDAVSGRPAQECDATILAVSGNRRYVLRPNKAIDEVGELATGGSDEVFLLCGRGCLECCKTLG